MRYSQISVDDVVNTWFRVRTPTFLYSGKLKRRTWKKAPPVTLESKRENSGTAQLVTSLSVGNSQVRLDPPEDIVVLYQTLVRDQALPAGFEEAFSTLAPHISPAASRQQGRLAMTSNTRAPLDVHEWRKRVSTSAVPTGSLEATEEVHLKTPKSDLPGTQRTSRDGRSGKGPVDQAPGRSAPGFTHAHGRDSSSKTGRRVIARCREKGLHFEGPYTSSQEIPQVAQHQPRHLLPTVCGTAPGIPQCLTQ